jgi:hypothetical protein
MFAEIIKEFAKEVTKLEEKHFVSKKSAKLQKGKFKMSQIFFANNLRQLLVLSSFICYKELSDCCNCNI